MKPHELLQSLVSRRCWYVSSGGATAPSFMLIVGDKIPRDRELRNRHHPEDYRQNRGTHELLVWCSWRLQTNNEVLASSDQETDENSPLLALAGGEIAAVEVSSPAWDIRITFNDGRVLVVFCDHVPPAPSASRNWECWLPGHYVEAGPGTIWRREANGRDPLQDDTLT